MDFGEFITKVVEFQHDKEREEDLKKREEEIIEEKIGAQRYISQGQRYVREAEDLRDSIVKDITDVISLSKEIVDHARKMGEQWGRDSKSIAVKREVIKVKLHRIAQARFNMEIP